MNGNRFGHRLALNLVGGRAVSLLEKFTNDGGLSCVICKSKLLLSFGLSHSGREIFSSLRALLLCVCDSHRPLLLLISKLPLNK